jgi:hypothetical protein
MVSGAEVSPLRDANIAPNCDIHQIVDPDVFTYPGAAPEREEPRVFDTDAGLDHYRISKPGAEDSQESDAQPR